MSCPDGQYLSGAYCQDCPVGQYSNKITNFICTTCSYSVLPGAANCQEGYVGTLAGSGQNSNVDGVGTSASFTVPYGVAADGNDHVYVAEYDSYVIRRITISTQYVETFAGVYGSSGTTNGQGTNAEFVNPFGLSSDKSGNIYVADSYLIRKMTPDGDVKTIAGNTNGGSNDGTGTGTNVQFSNARGIVVYDLNGVITIYVSCYDSPPLAPPGYSYIRKIDSNLEVTNLVYSYLIDYYNVYQGDGLAVTSKGYLYEGGLDVVINNIDTGGYDKVTTYAGEDRVTGYIDAQGTNARFSDIEGIAIDAYGYFYVSDTSNSAIRRVSPSFSVSSLVGNPIAPSIGHLNGYGSAATIGSPYGIAIDSSTGCIFFADQMYYNIRIVSTGCPSGYYKLNISTDCAPVPTGYYLGSNQSNVIYRASTPVVSPSFSPTSPTNIDSSDAKFQISEGVVVAIIVGFIIVALVVMLFLFKRHRWKAEAEMNPKSKDYINRSEIYLPERNSSRGAKQDRDILDRLSESSQPNHDMVVKSNGINERLIQPVVPIAQPLYINTSNGTNQYHDKGLQV